ncbi:MAG: hypothetical protein IJI57_04610 [Flexilinea sp.]|nr:hypothetical protein [Flexilinea sp.]
MERRIKTLVIWKADYGVLGKETVADMYFNDDYEKGRLPYHTERNIEDIEKYINSYFKLFGKPIVNIIYR